MRRALLGVAAAAVALVATGCAGSTSSQANIDQGEYSGVTALGQSVVIDVSGSTVKVNSAQADFPDATTNAQFTVSVGGTLETFDCANADGLHTLRCTVTRARVLQVKVPCNLLASPPPSASPSATAPAPAGASPSASAEAQLPTVPTTPMCDQTLPRSETVTLLHLCSSAPCPDTSTQ